MFNALNGCTLLLKHIYYLLIYIFYPALVFLVLLSKMLNIV